VIVAAIGFDTPHCTLLRSVSRPAHGSSPRPTSIAYSVIESPGTNRPTPEKERSHGKPATTGVALQPPVVSHGPITQPLVLPESHAVSAQAISESVSVL
jgi:hypothetical protein